MLCHCSGLTQQKTYGLIATFQSDKIKESSGIVASHFHEGVFWTHNDSGNTPYLYAIKADGTLIKNFRVSGGSCVDWEDIAMDNKGNIYIADVGDNFEIRFEHRIHKIEEPKNLEAVDNLKVIETIDVHYHEGACNCEALCLNSKNQLMLITKSTQLTRVYLYDGTTWREHQTLDIKGCVTASDINDHGELALLTYQGIYIFIENSKGEWQEKKYIPAQVGQQSEAICWSQGDLIVTNEQTQIYRINPR